MASYLENLKTARDQVAANLVTITASPKPNYMIDGQLMSWAGLFQAYTEQLAVLDKAISAAEPFELESFGY